MDVAVLRLAVLAGQLSHQTGGTAHVQRHACSAELKPTAVICGGVVLDVQAFSTEHVLQRGGSVPGTVQQVAGGVARNIADAASQLVSAPLPPPTLLSVVGCDPAGQALMDNLKSLRLDVSGVRQVAGMRTASVCIIMDGGGEVACCVADVTGPEQHLTPALLQDLLRPALRPSSVSHAALVVVETNLSEAAVHAACMEATARGVPVLLEPVSAPKAVRAVSSLEHIAWVTPNGNELVAMADELCALRGIARLPRPDVHSGAAQSASGGAALPEEMPGQLQGLMPFAALLLNAGVKRIVLTLGADGAVLLRLATTGTTLPELHHPSHSPLTQQHMVAVAASHTSHLHPAVKKLPTGQPPGTSHHLSSTLNGNKSPSAAPWNPASGQEASISQSSCISSATTVTPHHASAPLNPLYQLAVTASTPGVLIDVVHLPALPTKVVNLSGAGDTLVGGLVAALLAGAGEVEAVAVGVAAARATVGSAANVAPGLSWATLQLDVERILQGVTMAQCTL